jgi:hypothetical protein
LQQSICALAHRKCQVISELGNPQVHPVAFLTQPINISLLGFSKVLQIIVNKPLYIPKDTTKDTIPVNVPKGVVEDMAPLDAKKYPAIKYWTRDQRRDERARQKVQHAQLVTQHT